MATNESLPTSGGHYYDDAEAAGFVEIARANVDKAKAAVTAGEVGATAVATAVGFVAARFVTGGISN